MVSEATTASSAAALLAAMVKTMATGVEKGRGERGMVRLLTAVLQMCKGGLGEA